jgi:hypothetical protein
MLTGSLRAVNDGVPAVSGGDLCGRHMAQLAVVHPSLPKPNAFTRWS